jgi:hypothetical protein
LIASVFTAKNAKVPESSQSGVLRCTAVHFGALSEAEVNEAEVRSLLMFYPGF